MATCFHYRIKRRSSRRERPGGLDDTESAETRRAAGDRASVDNYCAHARPTRLLTEISLRFVTGNKHDSISVVVNILPDDDQRSPRRRSFSVRRPVAGPFRTSRAPSTHAPSCSVLLSRRQADLHYNLELRRRSTPSVEERIIAGRPQNSRTSTVLRRR